MVSEPRCTVIPNFVWPLFVAYMSRCAKLARRLAIGGDPPPGAVACPVCSGRPGGGHVADRDPAPSGSESDAAAGAHGVLVRAEEHRPDELPGRAPEPEPGYGAARAEVRR